MECFSAGLDVKTAMENTISATSGRSDSKLWFLEMVQELQARHDRQDPCRRAPPDGPRLSKPARRQRRGRRRRSTREDVKVWDRAPPVGRR
jgi:hypothetical protein